MGLKCPISILSTLVSKYGKNWSQISQCECVYIIILMNENRYLKELLLSSANLFRDKEYARNTFYSELYIGFRSKIWIKFLFQNIINTSYFLMTKIMHCFWEVICKSIYCKNTILQCVPNPIYFHCTFGINHGPRWSRSTIFSGLTVLNLLSKAHFLLCSKIQCLALIRQVSAEW